MLDDLKAELVLARNTENALHKQITRLQADATTKKKQIATLKTELKQTSKDESESDQALQQKVKDLQIELKTEKASVQTLQKELKKSEPLKTELAEAKKTILQLADTNSGNEQDLRKKVTALQADLKQEKAAVQSLKKELKQADKLRTELDKAKAKIEQLSQASSKASSQSTAKSTSKLARTTPSTLATSKPQKFLKPDPKFKRLRSASMKPGKASNSELTNSDIGWFD